MKKLTYACVCYGCTLAIILAIAILPFSGWALRNHLDVLTGGWQSGRSYWNGDVRDTVEPTRIAAQWSLSGPDESKFGKGYPLDDSFKSYVIHAHAHPDDVGALAHVVRQSFRIPLWSEGPLPDNDYWRGWTIKAVRAEGLWAAQRGMKLDPDNAYFCVMAAALFDKNRDRAKAYDALRSGGNAKRFDEYAANEAMDREAYVFSHWGYRGEKVRAEYLGSILLPHWAALKAYGREVSSRPATKENVQARADTLRIADTMAKREPYIIGVLVAIATAKTVLLHSTATFDPNHPDLEEKSDNGLLRLAVEFNALQSKLQVPRSFDPTAIAKITPKVSASVKEMNEMNEISGDPLGPYFSFSSTAPPPAFLFATVVSILLAVLTFKTKQGSERARLMLPYIASITLAWVLAEDLQSTISDWRPMFYWGESLSSLGMIPVYFSLLMIPCGLMQLWKPLSKVGTWLAIIGNLGIFLTSFPIPDLFFPSIAFVMLLLFTRITWKCPATVGGLLMFLVVAGGALLYVEFAFRGVGQISTAVLIAIGTFMTLLFSIKGSRPLLAIMPAVTLIFAIGYLGATVRELKQNQEIKASLDGWTTEADLLRARAGIR